MNAKSNNRCSICDELGCAKDTRLSRALADTNISNAVLMSSEHFAVIPSVGPLVLGHSLVVTRAHSTNIIAGLLPVELDELRHVCFTFFDVVAQPNAQQTCLLCFEHGLRYESRNSLCSTGHGHLHQVPLGQDQISAALKAIGGKPFCVNDFQQIRDLVNPLNEYIVVFSLLSGKTDITGTVLDATDLPSQYLRQVIASQIGVTCWDWKTDVNPDLLRQTLALGFELNKKVDLQTAVLI